MIIRGLTREQIEKAVYSVPNADWEYINPLGRGYRVKLRVKDSKGPYHRRGMCYRNSSYIQPDGSMGTKEYPPKRLASLCWHGFKEVFEAMYHRETGYQDIGSMMCPVQYNEACDC